MTSPQPQWRKSSYTNMTDNGECVETADLGGGIRGIRDSKNPGLGNLTLPTTAFADLVRHVKSL